MNIPKFLTSSADPTKISTFIRGILLSLVPLAMAITGATEVELNSIIDVVVDVVFLTLALIASIQAAYGLARKFYLGRWSSE